MWRLVVRVMGALGLAVGLVALLAYLDVLREMAAVYTLVLPPILLRRPVPSVLADAAHGPPFLTLPGILLFYFAPGAALVGAARRHPHPPTQPATIQEPQRERPL